MYKGFAAAIVLFALAVGFMADRLPKGDVVNATMPAARTAEPASTVAQPSSASPDESASLANSAAPLAGADAPTLTFDDGAPASKRPDSAPESAAPARPDEINPIPTGEKLPPGKVLTSTFQTDPG